ncbi:MAG: hypothetical protein QM733_17925 [Ilumatobacteraceae bacterium]
MKRRAVDETISILTAVDSLHDQVGTRFEHVDARFDRIDQIVADIAYLKVEMAPTVTTIDRSGRSWRRRPGRR